MSNSALKNKIYKSIEEMNPVHLQSAYQILREFIKQEKYGNINVERIWLIEKLKKVLSNWTMEKDPISDYFLKK